MRTLPRNGRECSPAGSYPSSTGLRIALYFTGCKHAGENLADVLKQRAAGLDAPIQMCDALSRNLPKLPGAGNHCWPTVWRMVVGTLWK